MVMFSSERGKDSLTFIEETKELSAISQFGNCASGSTDLGAVPARRQ
jgi:hypothetical protein